VADGTIESIDLANGGVTIRHTAASGKQQVWFTRYLHMPMEEEVGPDGGKHISIRVREFNPETGKFDGAVKAEMEVAKGQQTYAGVQFGYMGKRTQGVDGGKDGTMKAHLHFEAQDADGRLINMANLLTDLAIQTYADGPDVVRDPATGNLTAELRVTWDNALGEWVMPEYGLIFSRKARGTGLDNVWVAFAADPAERRKVVWVKALPDGEKVDGWLMADDPSRQWDSALRTWRSRQ
jgi:hypothetical protein